MTIPQDDPDPLLAACAAMLQEVAGYPITAERLQAAGPVIREVLRAIRVLDKVDVSGVEPMTIFRPRPRRRRPGRAFERSPKASAPARSQPSRS